MSARAGICDNLDTFLTIGFIFYTFALHTMLKRLLNILALLVFVNAVSYMPAHKGTGCHATASEATPCESSNFSGGTLFHAVLVDIFDIPASESLPKKIFFRVYMLFSVCYAITLIALKIFYSLKKAPRSVCSGSLRFQSKLYTLPGYYTYLFRLKPF